MKPYLGQCCTFFIHPKNEKELPIDHRWLISILSQISHLNKCVNISNHAGSTQTPQSSKKRYCFPSWKSVNQCIKLGTISKMRLELWNKMTIITHIHTKKYLIDREIKSTTKPFHWHYYINTNNYLLKNYKLFISLKYFGYAHHK